MKERVIKSYGKETGGLKTETGPRDNCEKPFRQGEREEKKLVGREKKKPATGNREG